MISTRIPPRIPNEVLAIAATFLQPSPRHVFILMRASKFFRAHLTAEWWKRFWEQYKIYKGDSNMRHWILRANALGPMRPAQYSHLLRLGFALRCDCCGSHWHHRVNVLTKLRICNICFQDQFISNRVLYYQYNLSAAKLIDTQGHLLTWTPMEDYTPKGKSTRQFTSNPVDLEGFDHASKQRLVFLWRPDIAALYDLPALRMEQTNRKNAASFLAARFRRAQTERTMWSIQTTDKKGNPVPRIHKRHAIEELVTKISIVVTPPSHWMPGGPDASLGWMFADANEPGITKAKYDHRIRVYEKFRSYVPRVLTGFGEVTPKTWLSKFGSKVPPPDDIPEPYFKTQQPSMWIYDQPTYSVKTLQRITDH